MKKAEATNTFDQGLIMDFNPLVTPNNTLSNALNATLITRNGNENVLQNDMGNGRVETAYLPKGYVPLGITQLGGIIYIVSYNPRTNKCQIGSFPSPEKNITTEETGQLSPSLNGTDFVNDENIITTTRVKKQISNQILHAGDKYIVGATNLKESNIVNLGSKEFVRLYLATIDSNGRLLELGTRDLYKVLKDKNYFLYPGKISSETNLDEYRNFTSSGYQVYSSKIAGNLYIIAELNIINSFDVTYKCVDYEEETKEYTLEFELTTTPENTHLQYARLDYKLSESAESAESAGEISQYYERDETTETSKLTLRHSLIPVDEYGKIINREIQFILTPCMEYGIYQQLKQTVTINFALLGTGVIDNSVWRYYKQDSSMYLVWDLQAYPKDNEEIKEVNLYFYRFDSRREGNNFDYQYKISISGRTSYSGGYSSTIPFSNIDENSLYFVKIEVCYESINGEERISSNPSIMKCMYTNGVFNDIYINESSKLDFDTIQPELTYLTTFQIDENINQNSTLKHNTLVSTQNLTPSPTDRIRGADIYEYSGRVTMKAEVGFEENYGETFTVDQNMYNVNYKTNSLSNSIARSFSTKSTNNAILDSDYFDLEPVVGTSYNTQDDYLEFHDQYVASIETNDKTFTLDLKGIIYNKVSADSSFRTIQVQRYVTPVVYNQETASKYGLTIHDDYFYIGSDFVCLGISGGGSDNNGGGAHFFLIGKRTISGSTNNIGYNATIVKHPSDKEDGLELGKIGEGDDNAITQYIKANISSVFPIMLLLYCNVGDKNKGGRLNPTGTQANQSYIDTFTGSDVDNNHLLTYNSRNDAHFRMYGTGGSDERRGDPFGKEYTGGKFLMMQVCMLDEFDVLHTTNNFFAIKNPDGTINASSSSGITSTDKLGNILASLLCQLYSISQTGVQVNGYAVNDIIYFDSLSESWTSKFEYTISKVNSDDGLMFKTVPYNTIRSDYESLGGNKAVLSLNPILNGLGSNKEYSYTYTVNLGNPSVLGDFLQAASNAFIQNLVISNTGESVEIPENLSISNNQVYVVENGKLSDTLDLSSIKKITSVNYNDSNDSITIQTSSDSIINSSVRRSQFYWDIHSGTIKLSNTAAQTRDTYGLQFTTAVGDDYDSGQVLYHDIKIFKNCNLAL